MLNFSKQVFQALMTLVLIFFLTFILMHAVPGTPFSSERQLPPEIEANLFERYHLSQRQAEESFSAWVYKDLKSYLSVLASGNMGPSLKYVDRDVVSLLADALPPTLLIGSLALLLALGAGLLTALFLALKTNNYWRGLFSFLASISLSLPSFIKAIFLISLFALILDWFPVGLFNGPSSWFLPIFTLAWLPYFLITELLLTEMDRENSKLYVTTALAKGLSAQRILLKHVLKNSWGPLLAVLPPLATDLLTGSFVVEFIFSIPGLGRQFVQAVVNRDYFLVMASTLLFSSLLLALNFCVDRLHEFVDPRRMEHT